MSPSFRFSIKKFRRLASTNTTAQQYAKRGAKEGLVIVADYQTHGRGRLGRKWVSPAGKDLLFSILLRPPLSPSKAPLLTQIICRSVATVLQRDYKLSPAFKRPNDILIEGKKICGVLIESQSNGNQSEQSLPLVYQGGGKEGEGLDNKNRPHLASPFINKGEGQALVEYVVIGIGLNVNSQISLEMPGATSLKELLEKELDKEMVLNQILDQIRKDLAGIYAART